MSLYRKLFPGFFILVAIAQLYSTFHPYTLDWLNYLSKPLIMLSLLGWYLSSNSPKGKWYKTGIAAILFSLAGDALLMFQEEAANFFLLGIGAFLIAQVFYSVSFSRAPQIQDIPILKKYPLLMAVFAVYGVWVFTRLRPNLHEFELPVLFYMIAILLMGITALNRYGRVSWMSFLLVMTGALLFIVSDSLIAFSKFEKEIAKGGFWIMLTYIIAQYLMVRGLREEGVE